MRKDANRYRAGLPALFCCLLLLTGPFATAQSLTRQELESIFHNNPEMLYGYFFNYSASGIHQVAPPKGYKPFYLSHYGRHGARRTHQEDLYKNVLGEMDKAFETDGLTDHGKDVREKVLLAYEEAQGLFGELTPLGVQQHKEIARRMVENYPQIFLRKGVVIDAVSSNVRRCIMSMAASTSQLLVMNPSMKLSLSTGDKYMDYIAYDSQEWQSFNADTSAWHQKLYEFEHQKIKPDRLLSSIFLSPEKVKDPVGFAISLRWIVANTNALNLGVNYDDIFTEEELKDIWETVNYKFYTLYGPNPENRGIPKQDACRLLAEMLADANAVLKQNDGGAHLRYGHDVYIMKLMNLLQNQKTTSLTICPEDAALVWQDFRITPMAANVQWVFYRNKKGDVLVKLLLNEVETRLPLETECFPYYHWTDFRTYCEQLIDKWKPHQ